MTLDTETSNRPGAPARSRWWTVAGVVLGLGFLAYVGLSARQAAVPVGSSGPMPGMESGGGDRVQLSARDIRDRPVRLPGGRPGVVVFVQAGGCPFCEAATRAAARAARTTPGRPALTVVIVDAATTREDVTALARSVSRPLARYVIDDRDGSISSMLRPTALASAIVYDARGRVVARSEATLARLTRLLRRAGARQP